MLFLTPPPALLTLIFISTRTFRSKLMKNHRSHHVSKMYAYSCIVLELPNLAVKAFYVVIFFS